MPSNIIGRQLFELKKNSLTEFKIFWNLRDTPPFPYITYDGVDFGNKMCS